MTKQERAAWLAEKVLGWVKPFEKELDNIHKPFDVAGLDKFIYSPDGFFAVWDAVEKIEYFVGMEMYIPPDEELQGEAYSCTIRFVTEKTIIKCGKDRYEAFYNAVYEAFKA